MVTPRVPARPTPNCNIWNNTTVPNKDMTYSPCIIHILGTLVLWYRQIMFHIMIILRVWIPCSQTLTARHCPVPHGFKAGAQTSSLVDWYLIKLSDLGFRWILPFWLAGMLQFHIVNVVNSNMSRQNRRGDFDWLKVPRIQHPRDAEKPAALGCPRFLKKVLTQSWFCQKVQSTFMSMISRCLTFYWPPWWVEGPDFLRLQKLEEAQLTWLPIPIKNTQKNGHAATPSFFWLPSVHIPEFIKVGLRFDFNTWPLKSPWKSPRYCSDAAT